MKYFPQSTVSPNVVDVRSLSALLSPSSFLRIPNGQMGNGEMNVTS